MHLAQHTQRHTINHQGELHLLVAAVTCVTSSSTQACGACFVRMQLLMEQSQVHGHIRRISPTSVSYASSLSIHACLHFCRLSQVKVVAVCYEGNENSMGSFIRDIRNIYDLVYSAAAGGPLPFMVTDPPPSAFWTAPTAAAAVSAGGPPTTAPAVEVTCAGATCSVLRLGAHSRVRCLHVAGGPGCPAH